MRWLEQYPRYFRGIQARLERSKGIPDNEQWAIDQLNQYWTVYVERAKRAQQQHRDIPELETWRWMLEEYRISLFAQSLGTLKPVSAKRLDKMLAELPELG